MEAIGVAVVGFSRREAGGGQPNRDSDDVHEDVGRVAQEGKAAGEEATPNFERQHAERENKCE
jgi:hypothetical protein